MPGDCRPISTCALLRRACRAACIPPICRGAGRCLKPSTAPSASRSNAGVLPHDRGGRPAELERPRDCAAPGRAPRGGGGVVPPTRRSGPGSRARSFQPRDAALRPRALRPGGRRLCARAIAAAGFRRSVLGGVHHSSALRQLPRGLEDLRLAQAHPQQSCAQGKLFRARVARRGCGRQDIAPLRRRRLRRHHHVRAACARDCRAQPRPDRAARPVGAARPDARQSVGHPCAFGHPRAGAWRFTAAVRRPGFAQRCNGVARDRSAGRNVRALHPRKGARPRILAERAAERPPHRPVLVGQPGVRIAAQAVDAAGALPASAAPPRHPDCVAAERRWGSRSGCSCRTRPTGAGCSIARTAPGIRRPVCSGSRSRETGKR